MSWTFPRHEVSGGYKAPTAGSLAYRRAPRAPHRVRRCGGVIDADSNDFARDAHPVRLDTNRYGSSDPHADSDCSAVTGPNPYHRGST